MASCRFKTIENIGYGKYTLVKKVEYQEKEYALKLFHRSSEQKIDFSTFPSLRKNDYASFLNPTEVDILFRCNSSHLVKGLTKKQDKVGGITEFNECSYESPGLAMEYIKGNLPGNLFLMDLNEKKQIMKGLAKGIQYLHKNKILYLNGDIQNSMYRGENKEDKVGVLIDFSKASYCRDIKKGIFTRQERIPASYCPPESLFPNKQGKYYYNNKSDIWSLAVIFTRILSNNTNYLYDSIGLDIKNKNYQSLSAFYKEFMNEKTIEEFVSQVLLSGFGNMDEKDTLHIQKLLIGMFHTNSSIRFDIDQVLKHPFFEGVKEIDISSDMELPKNEPIQGDESKFLIGVVDIVKFCREKFLYKKIGVLFVALDLYLRYLQKYKSVSLTMVKICCFVALKWFYWSERDELDVDEILYLDSREFLEEEAKLYKALEGKIYEERYYQNAKSHLELAKVYYNLIYPNSRDVRFETKDPEGYYFYIHQDSKKYLNQDGKEYIRKMGKTAVDNLDELTIEKFFYI